MKRSIIKRSIAVLATIAISATGLFSSASPNLQTVQAATTPVYYEKDNGNLRNVMYYGDWSTGEAQGYFNPDKIPAEKLTHLNFAFLDFDRRGNLQWCEKEASVDDVVGIEGAVQGAANAGILSGLIELRAKNPNLRIGVSVGGWAKSGDFSAVAKNAATRKKLADNLAAFVKYTQMDFVDVDWEYPGDVRQPEYMDNQTNEGTPESSPDDMQNYILLLQDIRASLDELSKEVYVPDYSHWDPSIKINKYYELSVAISANENVLAKGTDIEEVFKVCDFVNVMTYDTTGQWNGNTGHHTALKTNPELNNRSIDNTVQHLLANGAVASKIVIGCAFYSRGWQSVSYTEDPDDPSKNDPQIAGLPGLGWTAAIVSPGTNGYVGNSNGTAGRGADNYQPTTWGDGGYAAGIWPYYNFADLKAKYPSLQYYYDTASEAPYLYAENGAFFTFDDERSITAKAQYVKDENLGGLIAWMQSQDAETVAGSNVRDSLTTAMKNGLFGTGTDLAEYKQFPEGPDMGITYVYNKTTGNVDFKLQNKSGLSESNEVLKEVEESYKTIFTPTLYIKLKDGMTLSAGENCGSVEMIGDVAVIYLYENDDMIDPKESIKFSLKPNKTNSYGIDSIILTQRIVPTSTEFYFKLLTWSAWEASTMFDTPTPKPIAAPTLGIASKTLQIGEKQKLSINNEVKGSVYSYSSSNSKVASVSSDGQITAIGAGSAQITCVITTTNNTYTLKETVTVSKAPQLSSTAQTLVAGNSFTLKVNNPLGGSTYTWKSSNTKVATVSSTGVVKAVAAGKSNITCTVKTAYNTYNLQAAITVSSAPALSVKAKTVAMGKSYTLKVNNKISKSTYTWKSSNKKVATVSTKGVVKAMSPGTSTITCTVKAPSKTYTLKAKITVTGPKFTKTTVSVKKGGKIQLKISNKVSGSKYVYKSANKNIASVDSKGVVKGIKKGNTAVTAKITFPKKTGLKALTLKTKITVK